MKRPPLPARQIWLWPLVLGAQSLLGLLLALFDDAGPLDVFAWYALGCVVIVSLWCGMFRRHRRKRQR